MGYILRTKDSNGNWVEIPAVKGDRGPQGTPGKDGDDYILTQADIDEIVQLVVQYIGSADTTRY